MKNKLFLLFIIFSIVSCSYQSKLVDNTELYIKLLDAKKTNNVELVSQLNNQIDVALQVNLENMQTFDAKTCKKEIKFLSDKINKNVPGLTTLYAREQTLYKRVYFQSNYENLKLIDIPLQYRKEVDRFDEKNPNFIKFDNKQTLITDDNYRLSGSCIASIKKIEININGNQILSKTFATDESNDFDCLLDTNNGLQFYENDIVIKIYRTDKEMYSYNKNVYVVSSIPNEIKQNQANFEVKSSDKKADFEYDLYEIDLTKCKKNCDIYDLDLTDINVKFFNKIENDKFILYIDINGNQVQLFENNKNSNLHFTLKHYTNNDILMEFYTGEQNFTDYVVFANNRLCKATDLAKDNDITNPIIMNKVYLRFVIAQYDEVDKPVVFYYFDENLELTSILKKQIDKYLYKTFTKDEIYQNF